MTDKAIELDARRGMAAQKATDLRRLLADVEANEAALRLRQDELEAHLIAAPAANWEEAAGKARYLLNLFAATRPRKTHAGKHSSRPCSLIFGGSRPSPSEQPGNCAAQFTPGPARKISRAPIGQRSNGIMALNFPNRSRSRRAVRFWGHDGPMEASCESRCAETNRARHRS
jgi:hypothetical protein